MFNIISLLSSIFGTSWNNWMTNQRQEAQNEWQSREAEKAFERQKELMGLQSDFYKQNLDYSFSQQADYEQNMSNWMFKNFTSPSAQAQAYSDAGLNPGLAMSNGAGGVMSSGIQSSSGSPSAAQPEATAPQASGGFAPLQSLGSLFSGLSSLMKAPSDIELNEAKAAKESGKDPVSHSIMTLNDYHNRLMDSEARLNDAKISETQIYGSYLEVKKAVENIYKDALDAGTYVQRFRDDGSVYYEEIKNSTLSFAKAAQDITHSDFNVSYKQYHELQAYMRESAQTVMESVSRIALNKVLGSKASAERDLAFAEAKLALTKDEEVQLKNEFQRMVNDIKGHVKESEMEAIKKDFERQFNKEFRGSYVEQFYIWSRIVLNGVMSANEVANFCKTTFGNGDGTSASDIMGFVSSATKYME